MSLALQRGNAMLGARGLYGHIQNNAMKSVALLSGFVGLTMLFWYAWCIVYVALFGTWFPHKLHGRRGPRVEFDFDMVLDILDKALDVAIARWWLPLVLSALWFIVAYVAHADMIRLATGAQPVTRKEAPKLYNIVENLAITAGLPMPRVEIIRSGALNAYAAGLGPNDAVVAVTRGLLQELTDEELEAVIAHEMTHIKNHDVRLMVVATCFAGGLTLLGDGVAKLFANSSSGDASLVLLSASNSRSNDSDGEGNGTAVIISLLIAVLFFCMAHLFAILIHFAISRAREFMADAGAVELTKNPDALISALQKISGNDEIPGLNSNVKAMMISSSLDGLFATHPSIQTRVMALQQYAGGRVAERAPRRAAVRATAGMDTGPASVGALGMAPAGALGIAGGRATFGRKRIVGA